jgi:hypothetical protein
MTSKTTSAAAPRAILLRCGAMPNDATVNESEEELSSLKGQIQRQPDDVPPPSLLLSNEGDGADLSEEAVLLHSLFSKFCHPPPSVASVLDILLLERQRVLSLEAKTGLHDVNDNDDAAALGQRCLEDARKIIQNNLAASLHSPNKHSSLPKDVVIHTSPTSAQSIIAILVASPKSCLLKLPLEFQLAFCRILVRLLSDESDEEFDSECLFSSCRAATESITDCRNGEDFESAVSNVSESSGEKNNTIDDKGESSSSEDETYNVISRQSTTFNLPKSSLLERKTSDSSPTYSFQRTNTNNNSTMSIQQQQQQRINESMTYKAWNYARWNKKKLSSLYSIARFCSNQQWEEEGRRFDNSILQVSSGRSQSWDYVADHVKLDGGEEEEEDNGDTDEDSEGHSAKFTGGIIASLINIYKAIQNKCSDVDADVGQHLLLGPVAHLIGLVCSTGVSVKSLRLLLVFTEKPPAKNNNDVLTEEAAEVAPFTSLTRLHILRALRYAAEYSTQSNGIHDKVGPRTFFSFGEGGPGLTKTFHHMPWPFKYDFGMACWFRLRVRILFYFVYRYPTMEQG